MVRAFLGHLVGRPHASGIRAATPNPKPCMFAELLGARAQHMALGVAGLGCEDALTHLLNYVWPNIFETSPHVVNAVMGAVDGCRLALGPAIVLNYTLQARRAGPICVLQGCSTQGRQDHALVLCWRGNKLVRRSRVPVAVDTTDGCRFALIRGGCAFPCAAGMRRPEALCTVRPPSAGLGPAFPGARILKSVEVANVLGEVGR